MDQRVSLGFPFNQLSQWSDACLEIADRAGAEILRVVRSGSLSHRIKGDQSPVTEADLAAHHVIVDALARLTPDIPVISEEDPHEQSEGHDLFWLVDPLDGTREFIKGGEEFTVNISLVHSGVPLLGVITAPAKGKLAYVGGCDIPPRKRNEQGNWFPIQILPPVDDNIKIAGSKSYGRGLTRHWIEQNCPQAEISGVASSLKFCLIAEGVAHYYPRFGRTMEWDTAAGQAILSAAGGSVVTLDNQSLLYGKVGYENPHFVAQYLQCGL